MRRSSRNPQPVLGLIALVVTSLPMAAAADAGAGQGGSSGTGGLRLEPVVDSVLLGSGAVLAVTLELIASSGELEPQAPGSLQDVNPLDRWVAEGSSAGTRGPNTASNVTLAVAWFAPLLHSALLALEDGTSHGGRALVVHLETLAWTSSLTNLFKIAVRRPRPIAYAYEREGLGDPDDTDATLSFFSGHTSTVAASFASIATVELLRGRGGAWRPVLALVLGGSLTAATGALRLAAKRHFVTDVVVGAVVGTGIGVLAPLLHRVTPAVAPAVTPVTGGATLGLAGTL